MLSIINSIMVLIVIGVLVAHTILIIRTRERVDKLEKKRMTLVDLGEFDSLNKETKDHYKKYIVDGIMPIAMEYKNDYIEKNAINQIIRDNDDQITSGINSLRM